MFKLYLLGAFLSLVALLYCIKTLRERGVNEFTNLDTDTLFPLIIMVIVATLFWPIAIPCIGIGMLVWWAAGMPRA